MRRTRRNAPRFALENPVGYTDDESFAAVDHFDKVRADLFADRALLNRKASVRLDIPSSKPVNKGGRDTVVVTVHEPSSAKRVIGYDHTAVVKGALFQVTPAAARDIALGIMNKTPFSYVTGKLVGAGVEGQRAEAVGIPVYYDPRVVHLYVDARNGLPIKAAREVNFRYVKGNDDYYLPEIEGIYIWAVDPVYYAPGKAPGSVLGAKYGNTAPGAWDWAMTTQFALTGTPAKVVMPEGRENPADDDAHVRFVYGARRLARGGFAPVVTQHGPGGSAHEHGGWVAQGYDEDVALAVAKEHAEELASQYVGDWNIEIVSAEDEQLEHGAERAAWQARHEEGRRNPLSPEDKQWLENELLETIKALYARWRERGGREPSLTTSLLRDLVIEAAGVPEKLRGSVRRKQDLAVLNALQKLQRRGLIESSFGVGQRGKETKMWNPLV